MQKRVAIVGPAHPYRGGIAQYNHRLAKEFIAQGYEVVLYTFTLQYPSFLFPGKTQFSNDSLPEELKIIRAINAINPLNWIKVGRTISKQNFDLVILRYWLPFMAPCLGTISRIVRKNKHSKCIAIADNIVPHEKRMGDNMLTKYFVNSVDGFLVMSNTVKDDLKTFSSDKPCKFYPHPLYDNFGDIISKDAAKENLKLDSKKSYVLFFGLIRDYKGLDLLLEAFNDECFSQNNIQLIVAGEFYGSSEKYKPMIEKLGSNLILHDNFIPDTDVANYFCASDIVVQPYKSATQSGITQIAYHFNKPMLVTNVGGLPELVPNDKAGYCTEPTSESIKKSLKMFFDQHKEAAFSENVKQLKSNYSWAKLVEQLSSFLNN